MNICAPEIDVPTTKTPSKEKSLVREIYAILYEEHPNGTENEWDIEAEMIVQYAKPSDSKERIAAIAQSVWLKMIGGRLPDEVCLEIAECVCKSRKLREERERIHQIRMSDPHPVRILYSPLNDTTYTREDIIEKVREALKNPSTLYNQDVFNYLGNVYGERYTEIAAREVSKMARVKNLLTLRSIPKITRHGSYKVEGHEELAKNNQPKDSNRSEEWLAKNMYGRTYESIGKILDFQVPLKDKQTDVAGKIDLLSFNENDNTAYILELKKPESKETLLRCVLEAYTYWKTVDKEKLLSDFRLDGAELRKAVLVFKSCTAYADFQDDDCEAVYALMSTLGVDLFVLDDDGNNMIEGYKH